MSLSMVRRMGWRSWMSSGTILTVAAGLAVFLGSAGCSERDRVTIDEPETAEEFTDRGWDSFAEDDLESAIADFASAIALNPAFGPAYLGQGWTRVARSTSTAEMQTAVNSFDNAETRGVTGADLHAGRACAHLGRGTAGATQAISAATAARTADNNFVFSYRESFDSDDLFLIDAFANASLNNFAAALTSADAVLDSGIEQGNAATYVVDGTTYTSFEGAVLAHLHKLSQSHAG